MTLAIWLLIATLWILVGLFLGVLWGKSIAHADAEKAACEARHPSNYEQRTWVA